MPVALIWNHPWDCPTEHTPLEQIFGILGAGSNLATWTNVSVSAALSNNSTAKNYAGVLGADSNTIVAWCNVVVSTELATANSTAKQVAGILGAASYDGRALRRHVDRDGELRRGPRRRQLHRQRELGERDRLCRVHQRHTQLAASSAENRFIYSFVRAGTLLCAQNAPVARELC